MNFYFTLSKIFSPFILSVSNLILLIIFIFCYLYFKKKRKIYKFFLLSFISILLIASFIPSGNYFLKLLEQEYVDKTNYQNIDAILVLGGSEDTDTTKKTKILHFGDSSERHITTISLAQKYPNAKIIFSGTGSVNKDKISEVYIANLFYKYTKLDMDRLILLGDSRNTIENLINYSNMNKINKFNNVLLVTSAFHMKRSMIIANKLNIKLIPYAVDFRAVAKKKKFYNFDFATELKKFDLFFKEIVAIIGVKFFL